MLNCVYINNKKKLLKSQKPLNHVSSHSFGWGEKGSSDIPTDAFYRGPEPFSEPESSAVRVSRN